MKELTESQRVQLWSPENFQAQGIRDLVDPVRLKPSDPKETLTLTNPDKFQKEPNIVQFWSTRGFQLQEIQNLIDLVLE